MVRVLVGRRRERRCRAMRAVRVHRPRHGNSRDGRTGGWLAVAGDRRGGAEEERAAAGLCFVTEAGRGETRRAHVHVRFPRTARSAQTRLRLSSTAFICPAPMSGFCSSTSLVAIPHTMSDLMLLRMTGQYCVQYESCRRPLALHGVVHLIGQSPGLRRERP